MRLLAAVLAVLAASPSLAQPFFPGEPFPVTDARYAITRGAHPLLLSNGKDPVLFWSDSEHVRATRIVNGQPLASRAILPASDIDAFDAVWTGNHFLVVSTVYPILGIGKIVGALVAANGDAIGEPFVIIGDQLFEGGRHPRVAFNGERVLLMYIAAGGFDVYMHLLNADGTPAEPQQRSLNITGNGRIALTSNGDSFAAVIPRDSEPRLLLFDRNGAVRADSVFGTYGTGLSIASDGNRYLAVGACGDGGLCGPAYARIVAPDGSIGPAVDLDAAFRRHPSSVWTGAEWVVSYVRDEVPSATLQLVHLDASARVIARREQLNASGASLAVIGGQLMTAEVRGRQIYDAIYVNEIPASFAATRQTPLATASSNDASLVVWEEVGNHRTTLHAGTRGRDGRWHERQLLSVPVADCCYEHHFSVQAASDGNEFLIVTFEPETVPFGLRLDADGDPIGDRIEFGDVSFDQIVYDGDEYLLINSASRTVAKLSPSGALTQPVTLSPLVGQSAKYASDGNGNLFAVWVVHTFEDHYSRPTSLAGIRIGPNLQPLDAAPSTIALGEAYSPVIDFDGTQYAIAWIGVREVISAQVSPGGAIRVQHVADEPVVHVRIERVAGGSAIAWRNNASDFVPFVNRLALLRHDGSVSDPIGISAEIELGLLSTLPNGDLGWIDAIDLWGAPYEAMQRVTMRVIALAAHSPKPDAPSATLTRNASVVTISWTPPSQPVDGYRVEYRVGDGPWIETDRSYTPDRSLTGVPHTPGVRNAYRVRAWNAAGVSVYSNEVSIGNPRRRAVR